MSIMLIIIFKRKKSKNSKINFYTCIIEKKITPLFLEFFLLPNTLFIYRKKVLIFSAFFCKGIS